MKLKANYNEIKINYSRCFLWPWLIDNCGLNESWSGLGWRLGATGRVSVWFQVPRPLEFALWSMTYFAMLKIWSCLGPIEGKEASLSNTPACHTHSWRATPLVLWNWHATPILGVPCLHWCTKSFSLAIRTGVPRPRPGVPDKPHFQGLSYASFKGFYHLFISFFLLFSFFFSIYIFFLFFYFSTWF